MRWDAGQSAAKQAPGSETAASRQHTVDKIDDQAEDARNAIRHLGMERGFPPSIALLVVALEFANGVQ